jgi:predicted ATPase
MFGRKKQNMRNLKNITIENFKSIRNQSLELGRLNVFIGANGSGKSNLIEVFRFLREIVNQRLGYYTLKKGGADNLLYYGRKTSQKIRLFIELHKNTNHVPYSYEIILSLSEPDNFFIELETVNCAGKKEYYLQINIAKESRLNESLSINAKQVMTILNGCRIYHFHDTSDSAAVKGTNDVNDNRFLRPQAENLAAYLYWMQEKEPGYFKNIEDTIQQIAPFFGGFNLAPLRQNEEKIRLELKEKGHDKYFNASSLSDGTLRFICLVTLLMQPDIDLPPVIILDEPELGLHPAAINLLADLLKSAAERTQVIVATQSVTLINNLEPEDVWTVDREDGQSVFRHLAKADMSEWLEGYSLGDLWEKNIFGARP